MPARESQNGFTLIEVAFSVAILGLALTSLVALQTSYLRSYTYERSLVKAALVDQYLVAVWEADDNLPTPGDSTKPLLPILDKLGYFEENDLVGKSRADYQDWTVHRNIVGVGIPPLENVLRKMQVDVIWGPGPNEEFSIVYFVKGAKLPEAGSEDADGDETGDEDTSGDEEGAPAEEQDQ